MGSQHLRAPDDRRRAALHPAPELAGDALPDCPREALSALVQPHPAPFVLYLPIAVGLSMTIFESWHSSRAFGRALELSLLASMARVLAVLMSAYLWIRFLDLGHR